MVVQVEHSVQANGDSSVMINVRDNSYAEGIATSVIKVLNPPAMIQFMYSPLPAIVDRRMFPSTASSHDRVAKQAKHRKVCC